MSQRTYDITTWWEAGYGWRWRMKDFRDVTWSDGGHGLISREEAEAAADKRVEEIECEVKSARRRKVRHE